MRINSIAIRAAAALGLVAVVATNCFAQYTATLLPAPSGYAAGYGISGTSYVGAGWDDANYEHPLLWNGLTSQPVDLGTAGYTEAYAAGVSGNLQVGTALEYAANNTQSGFRAILWQGTAAGAVHLTPVGSSSSSALGISGTDIVGILGLNQGILWHGSANNYTLLGTGTPTAIAGNYEAGYDRTFQYRVAVERKCGQQGKYSTPRFQAARRLTAKRGSVR